AVAHRVNLRSRLLSPRRKEISLADRVCTVGLGMDADDFAAQIVRVGGRFLRVPWKTPWPFVDGCVAGGEGIGVVAGGDVKIAFVVEGDRASGVTALQPLSSDLEENLPRREIE